MEKFKFSIQGMKCTSCVTLIEEKLNNRPGINRVRVNLDSRLGIVIYDENKINQTEIIKIIEQAGNFQITKIEPEIIKQELEPSYPETDKIKIIDRPFPSSPKKSFSFGFLIGLSVISVLFNIYFLATSSGQQIQAKPQNNDSTKTIIQNQPPILTAPNPAPNNQASPDTSQSFTITGSDHIRGNINAPITLVEFSDFQCPYCQQQFKTLNTILANYPDKVRLVYKHFPLNFHANAKPAALASECADEQGKFWQYHDKLFNNQSDYSLENFKTWAADLDLDKDKFNQCLDSEKYATRVQNDLTEGQSKGVTGTPATFVNGKLVTGALPYDSFKQIIDDLTN